ncbi:MAG: DsbA family oxidoreductase [Pseudomonadota bacterium]
MTPVTLTVDIVSDVVCPWCIIGYKQLQRAFELLPGVFEPRFRWHPFELNPDMPPQGQELGEHLRQKYGPSAGGGSGTRERLLELGERLGFHFDYFQGMRMVNTFRAHQLLHWAGLQGRQTELKLALFQAFFSERKNVDDPDVLLVAAADAGLDSAEAAVVLEDGRFAAAVRGEQQYWREREVYAVPTFFLQDSYPVPGAQEAETLVRILRKIQARQAEVKA